MKSIALSSALAALRRVPILHLPFVPIHRGQPLPRRGQTRSRNRWPDISPRHRQYIEDERRRVRESLKRLGLSTNANEWPAT